MVIYFIQFKKYTLLEFNAKFRTFKFVLVALISWSVKFNDPNKVAFLIFKTPNFINLTQNSVSSPAECGLNDFAPIPIFKSIFYRIFFSHFVVIFSPSQ